MPQLADRRGVRRLHRRDRIDAVNARVVVDDPVRRAVQHEPVVVDDVSIESAQALDNVAAEVVKTMAAIADMA